MKKKTKLVIREWVESLVVAFILAMIIRIFIVQAFKIPTSSMEPTLMRGDRILVNKFIYRFKEPERWDIVVFKYPLNPKKDFIKRLAAKEGEKVTIINGRVFIDNKMVDNPYLSEYYSNQGDYGRENLKINIPKDNLFALGDNSFNSKDSRYWGFVPRKNLIGKAFLIYWPLNRIKILNK
ncbi:MAG: signal peptidase I [Candidatus Omnitrophota bacterium]|nr:signal peptidase I [Candidatus Omnitrophota bacterium]